MTERASSTLATPTQEARAAGRIPSPRAARHSRLVRLAQGRDVVLHLVARDFATRHRGSLLGWLWALVPPLLQLLVTYFLFTRVVPLGIPNYPLFLLTGILAWGWFSRGLAMGVGVFETQRALVLRPGFPTVLLPPTSVLIAMLDYLLALPILVIALVVSTGASTEALLLPMILGIQLMLMIGLAWALASLQVFFRDVKHITSIALGLGFWLTPIFYDRSRVPAEFDFVYDLNPMAHLIGAQREILLEGTLPSAPAMVLTTVVSLATAVGGYAVFSGLRHRVPEQL